MTIRIASLLLSAAILAACSRQAPEEEGAAQSAGSAAGTAASAAPEISVDDGWVRSTPAGNDITAAYFTLNNAGGADRLLGAASDQLDRIELHASIADANGVMRMQPLDGADIPAGGAAAFAPGGAHLMLYGAADAALGDTICLTLDFEVSDDQLACLPVMDDAPLQ